MKKQLIMLLFTLPLIASEQLLLVVSEGFDDSTAVLQRYELSGKAYQKKGNSVKVNLGRSGMGWGSGSEAIAHKDDEPVKREGDGRAPAGIFVLETVFGYAKTMATAMPYLQATDDLICVDDSSSRAYNTIVSLDKNDRPDSFEWMHREDGLYKRGVTVAHNTEQTPQAGSCIFLHVQKGENMPTSGCTSMEEKELDEIIGWLDARKRPLLVQVPRDYCRVIEKRFNGVTCP